MKAGDIKKFLEHAIASDRKDVLNPRDFNINDNFLLGVVTAYQKGEPAEHIDDLVSGFITTEELTVQRRVAVLKMVRTVFSTLSKKQVLPEDRARLKAILTAYFV